MKNTDQSDLAFQLTHALEQGEDHATMPGEFAGMYQSGFEAGYKSGHETGYDKGFVAGMAAVRQSPSKGATSVVEGKPALKPGPRRMLLGMPCTNCRIYLSSDETQCPCCKQVRTA